MAQTKHRKGKAEFEWSVESTGRDNGCVVLKYGARKIGFIFEEHATELITMLNAERIHPFCACCGKQPGKVLHDGNS